MPLLKGKENIGHNIKMEQKSGKSPKQSLAIALNVAKINKKRKKMASGGKVEQSASDEKRPSPSQEFADRAQDSKVHKKPLQDSNWLDNPSVEEAGRSKSVSPSSAASSNFHSKRPNISDLSPEEMNMIHEHRRKMAFGGAVDSAPSTHVSPFEAEEENSLARRMIEAEHEREALANGGLVSFEESEEYNSPVSIADEIMRKRRMSDGGQVDLEANSEESPNFEDQQSFKANGKEQYDLSQLDPQPEDSNEHGDDIDSDEHDMVSQIRRKMKSR